MPIRRTYACPECNHFWEIELTLDQADTPSPSCPACDAREAQQIFKAPGIVNSSPHSRASAITEDILANDYHVGDVNRSPSRSKLRYKDQTSTALPSSWGSNNIHAPVSLGQAMEIGRQNRKEFGTGLDMLQSVLKSGAQKDLIEMSKQRSAKIW